MKKANLILFLLLTTLLVACPPATDDSNGTANSGNGGSYQGGTVNPFADYPKWNVEVTNLTAEVGDKSIRVTWQEPTDPKLDSYWIIINDGNNSQPIQEGAGQSAKTFNNLENGREYTITIITVILNGMLQQVLVSKQHLQQVPTTQFICRH